MPGGHRAAEHQHSGSERHERDEPQRGSYGPDHPRHRGKRLPHRDRRDIRKTFGDLAHQRVLSLARRDIDRGEMGLRRGFEGARGEHDREIDAEPCPFDPTQAGDCRRHLAPEEVDGQRIVDLQAHALRQLGVKGNQRRALVIGRPPAAGDEAGPRRRLGRVGQAAVAAHCPLRLGRDRRRLDRRAVETGNAAAQHRHLLETRPGGRAHNVFEAGELIGLDVDEEIGRRMLGEARLDLGPQIAFDQHHRHQHAQAEAKREDDPSCRRVRPMQVRQSQPQRGS